MDHDLAATSVLEDLPFDELKRVLYERLHGLASAGPPIAARIGDRPYFWIRRQYRIASNGLRDRISMALGEFLQRVVERQDWPDFALGELLDLLQTAGERLIPEIRELVDRESFLQDAGTSKPAHAALLKCLIALNRNGSVEFWLRQHGLLGPDFGALVFSGLTGHGLEIAMSHLHRFAVNLNARRQLRGFLPVLVDRYGQGQVTATLRQQLPQLNSDARREFEEALVSWIGPAAIDEDIPSRIFEEERRRLGGAVTVDDSEDARRLRQELFGEADRAYLPISSVASVIEGVTGMMGYCSLFVSGCARNVLVWRTFQRLMNKAGLVVQEQSQPRLQELTDSDPWKDEPFRNWLQGLFDEAESNQPNVAKRSDNAADSS